MEAKTHVHLGLALLVTLIAFLFGIEFLDDSTIGEFGSYLSGIASITIGTLNVFLLYKTLNISLKSHEIIIDQNTNSVCTRLLDRIIDKKDLIIQLNQIQHEIENRVQRLNYQFNGGDFGKIEVLGKINFEPLNEWIFLNIQLINNLKLIKDENLYHAIKQHYLIFFNTYYLNCINDLENFYVANNLESSKNILENELNEFLKNCFHHLKNLSHLK